MNRTTSEYQIEAVAKTYHHWITGLTLAIISKKGASVAERFVFRLFRKQHLEKFIGGLEKLGLQDTPAAIACAKYHYFSNQLGGVSVEYLEESPKKAWIRYPPPRWIWSGTAICAIPANVNRAMLYGWHAYNGVTLNNPYLGFVCTGTTVEGAPGLEGFYLEYDKPLAENERLTFRFDLECPPIDKTTLPALDSDIWPKERKAKAYRNYAMAYMRTALPIVLDILGPKEGHKIGCLTAKQIGMQMYRELSQIFDIRDDSKMAFADFMSRFLTLSGDSILRNENEQLTRKKWRLFPGNYHPFATSCQISLFDGLLAAHNRFLALRANIRDGTTEFTLV